MVYVLYSIQYALLFLKTRDNKHEAKKDRALLEQFLGREIETKLLTGETYAGQLIGLDPHFMVIKEGIESFGKEIVIRHGFVRSLETTDNIAKAANDLEQLMEKTT